MLDAVVNDLDRLVLQDDQLDVIVDLDVAYPVEELPGVGVVGPSRLGTPRTVA